MKKVTIVAEIGINHNGSLNLAKKMVKEAKKCGADVAKFQNSFPDQLFKLKTKAYDDYGNLRLTVKNAVTPMIIQLVNRVGEVKYEQYVEDLNPIEFRHIDAGKYYIRIMFDSNQNKKYDSGSFLKRRSPEKVSYFPEELDVRAGWDLIQEFILN